MKWTPQTVALAAAGVGLLAVGLVIWRKGGVAGAASALGAGVVNTAGSVASGTVGAIGASVGLPTPDQTTTDASVARWIIDTYGYFEASKWAGAPALLKAAWMDAGTGTPPPAGSDLARALPPRPAAAAAPSSSSSAAPGRLYTGGPVIDPGLTFQDATSSDPLRWVGWNTTRTGP